MVSLTNELPLFVYRLADEATRENVPILYATLESALDYIMVAPPASHSQPHLLRLRAQLQPHYRFICILISRLMKHYQADDGSKWWSIRKLLMDQMESVLSGFQLRLPVD